MISPLLELVDLQMIYDGNAGLMSLLTGRQTDRVLAVDHVSLRLGEGETIAVVGESGSGKTTTGRIVTLQERPTHGAVVYDGKDVTDITGPALKRYRRDVQMIFQNPYEALDPRFTIGQSLREPLDLHNHLPARVRQARVLEMLSAVELRPAEAFADRYPADLSGGQLQRVAIARALILEPRIVVADEPVSMLDVSVRSGVMNLMLALQQRLKVSYLYITHDLAVARYMSDRIAVMYLGALVEEGPTEALVQAAGHPYTRLLIAAVPEHHGGQQRKRIALKGDALTADKAATGCRFHTRCPMARDLCRTTPPPMVNLAANHKAACHFAPDVVERGLTSLVTTA
ncbi:MULTISPECIES: oligopeptide/dipeptide ABC transporter ATP-binding protein [unclassified Chelatococcus]|uniref:ABC transporter ATP-binding protein n=1 Tax=unclassified Chelatococcus TaxID=2638111 RepID=UPI001BCCAE9C|nr:MULTISPECIES: oligopeptide/dipeptide ABC transporter ATP-binding protein [unclassified Chelatococcus]MBS7700536.1 ATP-binding cassette domain-containing protein [Chelatococcus sp. YT9]MBX3558651.1 ATP-binding cassette domain-containing protein [Chelatococcus sp.]